jgi:hypothetical protein
MDPSSTLPHINDDGHFGKNPSPNLVTINLRPELSPHQFQNSATESAHINSRTQPQNQPASIPELSYRISPHQFQNSATESAHINSANIIPGKLEPPSTNSATKTWLTGILPQKKNQPNPKCSATVQNDQTNNSDKFRNWNLLSELN